MIKNVWEIKLFGFDTFFICRDTYEIMYYINQLVNTDLHNEITIGTLQNVFKYSHIEFLKENGEDKSL